MTSTPFYRAIMLALDERRLELGWAHWQMNDISGLQCGYWSKSLAPDTPSGRQLTWPMLQLGVDALFPNGVEVIVAETVNGIPSSQTHRQQIRYRNEAFNRARLAQARRKQDILENGSSP